MSLCHKTYIHTPVGPIQAGKLTIGREIYSCTGPCNNIEVSKVINIKQKEDEALAVVYYRNNLAFVGEDTIGISIDERRPNGNYQVERLSSISGHRKLARNVDVCAPLGPLNEPHAYSIGVLLGDGCSRYNGKKIFISSSDQKVVDEVSRELSVISYKCGGDNYTHCLSNENKGTNCHATSYVCCNYYNDWIKNRYAHEKIVNAEIIKYWNRGSQIRFLSGLLDSDGSNSEGECRVRLNFSMQAKSVVSVIQYCILGLWQYWANINIDNRIKYKNGPVYRIAIGNNFFTQKAFQELTPVGSNKIPSRIFGEKTSQYYLRPTIKAANNMKLLEIDLENNGFFVLSNQGILVK